MKLVVTFMLYFLIFAIWNAGFVKKEKYKNLYLVFFLFLFSFYLSTPYYQINLDGSIQSASVHTVFIALILCLFFVADKSVLKPGKELILFIPLFLQALISVSYFKFSNIADVFGILNAYISIYLIVLIYRSIPNIDINKFLYSINYLALVNGILGIAQYITGKSLLIGSFNSSILYTEGAVDIKRVIGLAGANNAAGTFSAILFGVVLYNLLKKRNLFSLVALLITTLFAVLTFTRVGYVAIFAEILIFWLLYKPKKKRTQFMKIISFCFGLPIIAIVTSSFISGLINKLFTERGDTSSERFRQFQRAYDYVISNNWFSGVGIGQYKPYLLNHYRIADLPIHSQYLNVLAEQGVFILIVFVLFNFTIIYKILRNKHIDKDLKVLAVAIFSANFMCSNFNPNQFYYMNNVLYYIIMLGLYFYAKRYKPVAETSDKELKISA
ncbi:O-antigen ligase family protein [Priestia megaterium]